MVRRIKQRESNKDVYESCIYAGYPEIIARIIAGRISVFDKNLFDLSIGAIKPALEMAGAEPAVTRIAEAVNNNQTILIFTDYDVDGCTSMAVLYKALHEVFNVPASSLISLTGHRVDDGYGLTETVAERIVEIHPDLVITADAGISDQNRIEMLSNAGIDVIVTDHHLIPFDGIPGSAVAVVNPCQDNCPYDSKIAGCGVAWLLMTAAAVHMGCSHDQKVHLHEMLDYVALGTVADMVSLDSPTNRYFVRKGLEFMNMKNRPCWNVSIGDKQAGVGDLGFQIGPRINASSRITGRADTAVDFLLTDDFSSADALYGELSNHNSNRQSIENKMISMAENQAAFNQEPALVVYNDDNHPGTQGVVASKISERFGIPSIMLAPVNDDIVVGSGRAGQFLHIHKALQDLDRAAPGLMISFGGHRAAAGLKLHRRDVDTFKQQFCRIVKDQLKGIDLTPYTSVDGSLKGLISFDMYSQIERLMPFGIGFPTPVFCDDMQVHEVRVMGRHPVHLALKLDEYDAVYFYALKEPGASWPINVGDRGTFTYTLNLNHWNGVDRLQLVIRDII